MVARMLALVLVCPLASCSALFMTSAPHEPPATGTRVECTESRIAPVIDIFGATATTLPVAFFALLASDPEIRSDTEYIKVSAIFGTLFIASTVAYIASSRHGFASAKRCRQLHAASATR